MSKLRLHGTSSGYTDIAPTAAAGNNTLTAPTGTGTLVAQDAAGAIGITSVQSTKGNFTGDVEIADTIVHIGDTDTKIRFPSADTITAETGGSERLRIDSSGRLLLGTTTEGAADADDFTIASSTNTAGITIRTSTSGTGRLWFSDGTSGAAEYQGYVQYDHNTSKLIIGSGGGDKVIVDANGNTNITCITTAKTFVPTEGQLSNRNLIINGAMNVAQRGTSSTSVGYVTCDRFNTDYGGENEAMTYTQHDLTSSDTGPWAEGFRHSFHVQNGNQTGGAGAGDYVFVRTKIEAQDLATSGWNYTSSSSYITLSFWVKSSVAQNFYGRLESPDGTTYNYPFETGSLTANTWTKITKTIPGNSNLTINNDNGSGMEFHWQLFRGTNFTDSGVALNTWATYASGTRTPDATSTWWTTNDATWELTGVQLEVGSVATPFEHRSYGEELTRCQRYYQRWTDGYLAGNSQGADINIGVPLTVPLRAAPTVAGLAMHRSGNQSVTVAIAQIGYTNVNGTVVRVRTENWTSMSDETVYTVTPSSDTMELTAEL